jgi:hypothetical protein
MWQQPQQSFAQFGGLNQNGFSLIPQMPNGYSGFPNMPFPSPGGAGIHINPAFFNQPNQADPSSQGNQQNQQSQNRSQQGGRWE